MTMITTQSALNVCLNNEVRLVVCLRQTTCQTLRLTQASTQKNLRFQIVELDFGGRRFSTSTQTLIWIPDSFFSSLLSGRIESIKDETGAIFIDRDPNAFLPILNFLTTKELDLRGLDLKVVKHEAEFYGITPLVKRLTLCEDISGSKCGNFYVLGQPLNIKDWFSLILHCK